jgi:hypothetical protein
MDYVIEKLRALLFGVNLGTAKFIVLSFPARYLKM